MQATQVFETKQQLAQAAAVATVELLQSAIAQHGSATWVLAGGTTPAAAYTIIANQYLGDVDWSKVTFVIGDERIGPLDGPDNNWHVVDQLLLQHIPQAAFLRPKSDLTAEQAADDYIDQLLTLPNTLHGQPRLDVAWLGMGDDGHTLSLFPGHADFQPTDRLVIPVHHSPKPPADRISLTLHTLHSAGTTLILASGAEKAAAIASAQQPDSTLPIAQAARITNAKWFIDTDAASTLNQ
jgi:6-phosphogluconolactonase